MSSLLRARSPLWTIVVGAGAGAMWAIVLFGKAPNSAYLPDAMLLSATAVVLYLWSRRKA